MKKVVLLALNSSYSHTNLGLRYIREKLKNTEIENLEIVFIEKTINEPWLMLFDSLLKEQADIYAFSCYIWNRELIETLSINLKRIYPETKILWGGPDASSQAQFLLEKNPQVDAIISGEGDSVSTNWIISNLFLEKAFDAPNTLNPNTRLYADSEELNWAFPYTDSELQELNDRILYYEGSRGCAFKCTYCLSGNTFTARHKPLNEVLAELIHIISFNPRQLKFIDRTFNSDPERAFLIWQFLINKSEELNFRTNFHFEIAAELLTDEQLDLLATAKPGLFQFEIGAQTINPDVLKLIRRPFHPEKFKSIVSRLRSFENIHIHLDLIAGLPGETLKSQMESADYLLNLDPNMLQMGFLKILPNTPIKLECDKRQMVYQSFPPYEILQSDQISAKELMAWRQVESVVDIYYNSGQYFYIMNMLLGLKEQPFQILLELSDFIEREYGYRKISQNERYSVLANFINAQIKQYFVSDIDTINNLKLSSFGKLFSQKPDLFETVAIDLLKIDYFKQGMKSFPDWFLSFKQNKDESLNQLQEEIQENLQKANVRQRIRYEVFSFPLQELHGLENLIAFNKTELDNEKSLSFQGAGEVQITRQRLIHYLTKEILKNQKYLVAFQLSNPSFYILAEKKINSHINKKVL